MKKFNLSKKNKIPDNWEIKPFWSMTTQKSIIGNEHLQLLSVYLDRGVIKFSDIKSKRTNVTSEDKSRYQKVGPGDLVMNNQQSWRGSLGISRYSGIISPAYLIFQISKDLNPEFANYLFRDKSMVDRYLVCSRGVGSIQRNVHLPSLRNIKVMFPPWNEQRIISEFLDKQTQKIDSLTEKIEKKIELLKEQKTVLINQYVSKGMDPSVEMQNSGINSIGDIPKKWRISKIKYLSSIISKGTTPSTIGEEVIDSGDVRYIKSENIVDGNLKTEPEFYISKGTNELIKRSKLKELDILVVIAGAMVGKTAVMQADFLPANTNQAVSFIRPIDPLYSLLIYFWMQSNYVKVSIRQKSVVSAQPNLSMEDLGNFYIPVPPKEDLEQIQINLIKFTKLMNNLIDKNKQRINLLKEYRQSLISSVVTGKIRITEDMI